MESHKFSSSGVGTCQYQFHMYQEEFDQSPSQSQVQLYYSPSVKGHRR